MNGPISKDDYEEPKCLLNMHPEVKPVPLGRIIEKLDSYLNQKEYDAAERHLKYWLSESDVCHDRRGKLVLLNEQIGLYRKIDKKRECLEAADAALALAGSAEMSNTVTCATTLINAATGYKAFGKAEQALPLYRKAKIIYESGLEPNDQRLGGLYNNMALALAELGSYREAEELFMKALEVMKKQEHGEPEAAVTYLNLADLAAAESGPEDGAEIIGNYLDKAEKLLNSEGIPKDGYYAYVCEKCAPVFGYYGYFITEQELKDKAREIYERT